MTFLALFSFASVAPIIFYLYKKESVSIPICIYSLASIIGVIMTLSLLRIFNYDVYHSFLGFFYKVDTDVFFIIPETLETWKKTIIELSTMYLSGMQFLFSKILLISLIICFFACFNCIMTYLDDKYCNSESLTLAIISLVNLIACVGLSIASLFIGNSQISLYTFLDSLFAKVGIGLTFIGKALLTLAGIAVIIGILIWIINDKRMFYYSTKAHALELLSDLFAAIDEANLATVNFSETYSNNMSIQYIFWDAYETKTFGFKLHGQMEEWVDEWFSDEKRATASSYYNSFSVTFSFDIRNLINTLEEISSKFSPSCVPHGINYIKDCEKAYANVKKKVKKCNAYMEEYNEIMGHFPYDFIELSKLKKFQF